MGAWGSSASGMWVELWEGKLVRTSLARSLEAASITFRASRRGLLRLEGVTSGRSWSSAMEVTVMFAVGWGRGRSDCKMISAGSNVGRFWREVTVK